MKCILCSCPGWTLIRSRLSFQASLCNESKEEIGCSTGPDVLQPSGISKTPQSSHGKTCHLPTMGVSPSQKTCEVPWQPQPTHTPTGAPPGTPLIPKHRQMNKAQPQHLLLCNRKRLQTV